MAEYEPTDQSDLSAEEQILADIRADYDYDFDNWAEIRLQAAIDVAYASNNTWTTEDEALRVGRPMLNLDQLSQYRNQVENTVRQNKRGVKISPAGNGANDKSAELRANRIREIEYQFHAQEAYSQAFSDCLTRSYGFARIVAEYDDDEQNPDNQVFGPRPIPNPDQVLPDTDAQSTSGRDWKRCVFLTSMTHKEFKRDYPDARIRDFDSAMIERAGPRWMSATRVTVAEAWRVHETPNPNGKGRPKREVCMYLTNGVELLKKKGQPAKHPWKGKYIPFAACLGRIVYGSNLIVGEGQKTIGDSKKSIFSYIRFARDSAKGYNWAKSTLLEKLALPVKASLMGYKGQADAEALALIQRASKEHIAWIEFAAQTEATGTQVLPLPQYGTREPDVQADLMAADSFQRDIQNALGHFNAQDVGIGKTKVTSGVAIDALKRSGDLGSYDFQDHYDDFLKFLGEQYNDLLDHYDDTAKEVATRLPDGTVKMVKINTPTGRAPDGSPAYAENDARMGVGRHTVTISTGPSSDSQRDAGKEAAMALLQNPQAFPIIASDAVKLMDLGPIGDQMADDLEFLQPPAMQQARQAKEGGGPDPRQMAQENAKLKEQVQHAEGVMQQQHQELEGKQAELASKEKIAAFQAESTADLQMALKVMDNAKAIAVAHIQAASRGAAIDAHAAEEAQALGHEAAQAERDRQHEAARSHQDHVESLDAAQLGQYHSLESGEQAAALMPVQQPEGAEPV